MYLTCENCKGFGNFKFSGCSIEQMMDICEDIKAHLTTESAKRNFAICDVCDGEGKVGLAKLELL